MSRIAVHDLKKSKSARPDPLRRRWIARRRSVLQVRHASGARSYLHGRRPIEDSMSEELCRLCGGDGRIGNSLGRTSATCPGCHGSGRRSDTSSGFHDVTKTKASHYARPSSAAGPAVPVGPKAPTTSEGIQLASEVSASPVLAADAKARLLAEIMNHETTHGRCTKTFLKKVRKQTRA
jgi:hypothetical protein